MSLEEIFSCRGKVALVTGAASGLGFMFAEAMAEAGADVACADIDMDGLSDTMRTVEALGRKAIAIRCNVADEEQVKRMVADTVKAFGTIDIRTAAPSCWRFARPNLLARPRNGPRRVAFGGSQLRDILARTFRNAS